MKTAVYIAFFCACGGLSRYYLSGFVYKILGRSFPYGTLFVNILGSFLIGVVMEIGLRSTLIPGDVRLGITVGLMGGLTTFSSFSYETFSLIEEGNFLIASLNIIGSVVACLLFTWVGIIAARAIIHGGLS